MKYLLLIFLFFTTSVCGFSQNISFNKIDIKPVYLDTISFTEHCKMKHTISYIGIGDVDFEVQIIVKFTIDTIGYISSIDFPHYIEGIDLLYGNVVRILKTAKKFTPAIKNSTPVNCEIIMAIPYSTMCDRMVKWRSIFDKKSILKKKMK